MAEKGNKEADGLGLKIKRLVEERGWNQEEFSRICRLNRHTVRQILKPGPQRRLRNATVSACARALGFSVNELRTQSVEQLLGRMVEHNGTTPEETLRKKLDAVSQPDLRAWMERNPDRVRRLTVSELDEILAVQGTEGPLAAFGVEPFVRRLEKRRELIDKIHGITGSEYFDLLEQFINLIHDRIKPGM